VQQQKRSGIFSNVLLLVSDGWAIATKWVDVYINSDFADGMMLLGIIEK
jgi:hypothetical protein